MSFGTWRFDSSQPHLDDDARLAYWLNAYNSTFRDALAERPRSGHLFRHRRLFRRAAHTRDGVAFTLDEIEHGLLRGNKRPPYGLRRLLRPGDSRLELAPSRPDPRIHFALNCGARSCPPVRQYTPEAVDRELEAATLSYMETESDLDRDAGVLTLPGVVKLYRSDFGPDRELVDLAARALGGSDAEWIEANRDELEIAYAPFDWHLA